MLGGIYDEVCRLIENWQPQKLAQEEQYTDDLVDFLRKSFGEGSSFGGRISVKKESGRSLCDIGVNEMVGIELKKDLKGKSKIDRLRGQLSRHIKDYKEGVIIVLVGKTNKDSLEDLKDVLADMNKNVGFGFAQPRIKIIDKGTETTVNKFKGPIDWTMKI